VNRLRRTLTWYERNGDALVGEIDLRSIPTARLRRWFGLKASNPMVDSFPVGPKQAEQLRAALARPIDLDHYSYFVECSTSAKKLRAVNSQRTVKFRFNKENGARVRRAG